MIISDFYQTKIEASSYNVNIDATDTVITVSLIDFNGAAVTGKQVVLTCDKGYFNKNGSTAISGTDTKSITATTDSNGKITATWTASEWGLATFSTNNINTGIYVAGSKLIKESTNKVLKLYRNDNVMTLTCISTNNDVAFPPSWTVYSSGFVPSSYRPRSTLIAYNSARMDTFWLVNHDGDVSKRTTSSSQVNNTSSVCIMTWSI